MADCDALVGSGAVSYPCNLPPNHDGPHVARENPRSIRTRQDWEREHTTYVPTSTPLPAPAAPVPGPLEALGMQGTPKTSVDALTAAEGRESRREHPEEKRRRLAGDIPEASIEERLVTHAGGVSPDEMAQIGLGRPIDPYTRREVEYAARDETPAPTWETSSMTEDVPDETELTEGDVVLRHLVEIQVHLNEIARIVNGG